MCTDFSRLESPGVPSSLNSSKGVIRCPELGNCSEEEILEGTRSQGVTAIKRFKVKRNGELKNTNTFVFTFNLGPINNIDGSEIQYISFTEDNKSSILLSQHRSLHTKSFVLSSMPEIWTP